MNKIDSRALLEDVKANLAKLNSCTLHDFSINVHPERNFDSLWRCNNCGGEVGVVHKKWYERGLEHGKKACSS